jgi:hypothetical protein
VEVGVLQFVAPLEQPHRDEEESMGKKRTTQPGHAPEYGTADSLTTRQAADLKCRFQQEDFKKEVGIKGGGPRYSTPIPCSTLVTRDLPHALLLKSLDHPEIAVCHLAHNCEVFPIGRRYGPSPHVERSTLLLP